MPAPAMSTWSLLPSLQWELGHSGPQHHCLTAATPLLPQTWKPCPKPSPGKLSAGSSKHPAPLHVPQTAGPEPSRQAWPSSSVLCYLKGTQPFLDLVYPLLCQGGEEKQTPAFCSPASPSCEPCFPLLSSLCPLPPPWDPGLSTLAVQCPVSRQDTAVPLPHCHPQDIPAQIPPGPGWFLIPTRPVWRVPAPFPRSAPMPVRGSCAKGPTASEGLQLA